MAFVEFVPTPDLFACELSHYQQVPMPLHMARLIADELGEPHLRTRDFAAWYAYALLYEGPAENDTAVPFSLRIDIAGQVVALVPFYLREAWSRAVASLVPQIVAVHAA